MEKKTYVFTAGKHHANGKVYHKGDKIELTEDEAKGLANKVIDPEGEFGVSVSLDNSNSDEVSALKQRIAELELEVSELREAIDDEG